MKKTNKPKINKLLYTYIEEYDFWRVTYELEGYRHVVNLSSVVLKGLDMDVPDAVAYLLRAEIECAPERGERKRS